MESGRVRDGHLPAVHERNTGQSPSSPEHALGKHSVVDVRLLYLPSMGLVLSD